MKFLRLLVLAVVGAGLASCDRNLEAFDPNEKPRKPDLSRIFPAGAERAAANAAAPTGMAARASTRSGRSIEGTIELAPEIADRVPRGGVLFLIASHGNAGPPLAVKRIPLPEFPMDFSIGPEDRMTDATPFEGPLRLSARIDADGSATTRDPGDLQGSHADPLDPGSRGITLVIDEIL